MSVSLQHQIENWGVSEGYAALFCLPSRSTMFFKWPEENDDLLLLAANKNEKQSVYLSWCLFDQPSRKADTAKIVPGMLFDVDLAFGTHSSRNLPKDEQTALRLVSDSLLPEPSRIVRSGGGLYLHYLFDEPFEIKTERDRLRINTLMKGLQTILAATFSQSGYDLDNVSDLARITRPLGATNFKYGPETLVETLGETGKRYAVASLEALAGTGSLRTSVLTFAPLTEVEGEAKGSFRQVLDHCAALRELVEHPTEVSEPQWYAAATIAARCTDGEEVFHEVSCLDSSRYDEAETANKLRHGQKVKPRTCDGIAEVGMLSVCDRCSFRAADIASPYSLAFGDPQLLKIQANFVLTADMDGYHRVQLDGGFMPRGPFNDHFAHRIKNPHNSFIRDKRSPKVMKTDYLPGDSRLIVPEGTWRILNIWEDTGAKAVEGGCDTILDHIRYLVPDERHFSWMMDYLAHLSQKPGTKIASGITLIGGQGVGKSFVAKLLKWVFGPSNIFIDDAAIHASPYRSSLGNRQVLVIEEMATADKYEVSNGLKPWFTDETVQASDKFIRTHSVRTPRGIFVMTNHAVPAVLEQDDRRNAVFRVDAARRDEEYYRRLWEKGPLEAGAFRHWLQTRDIQHWSAASHPPMTNAKQEMIELSRTPTAMEIRDILEKRNLALVTANDLHGWVNPPLGPERVRLKQVTAAMGELGFRKLDRTKLSTGNGVNLWATKDIEAWLQADHGLRKSHYEGQRLSVAATPTTIATHFGATSSTTVPALH